MPWARVLLALLCVIFSGGATISRADPGAVLENIRVGLSPGSTRVVLDLDGPTGYRYQILESPRRLVVDLPATGLGFDLENVAWRGSPIVNVHSETIGQGDLRIIFDLDRAVEPSVFSLAPSGGQRHRLVFDLADAATASRPKLTALRLGRSEDHSRFVFDLDAAVKFAVTNSSTQPQLILELENTDVAPALLDVSLAGTPVSAISLVGTSRLVFTLSRPVEPRTLTLAPDEDRGHRVVLDLYPQDRMIAAAKPMYPADRGADQVTITLQGDGEHAEAGSVASRPAPHDGNSHRQSPAPPVSASDSITDSAEGGAVAFSGIWEQEWAVARQGGNQKFESTIEPRLDMELPDAMSLTAIGRLRLDTVNDLGPSVYRPFNYSAVNGPWYNNKDVGIDLRELYLDTSVGDIFMRLGKQQVVWGESDGIKVLDVVNPQSFREYILDDFDDSRIPLWMANIELPFGPDGSLQVLWSPDTTYHELAEAGTPYELTSPLIVPQRPEGIDVVLREPDKPDDPVGDSDIGARYRSIIGGWDISLNYFYSYADFPVPFQRLELQEGNPVGVLDPVYKRNHLAGGTASNAFGDFTVRTELAWNSDQWFTATDLARGGVEDSADVLSVIGLDWQGTSSRLVSAQWFYSRVLDYDPTIVRDRTEQIISLLLQQGWANDTWEFRALALHSLDYEDSLYQIKLKYWFSSRTELWVGADIFDGSSVGLFGQFDDYDRILFGFQYGF